uniref:Uncharacterized protein n=1 Tax=Heliothis virescens TaxID=7102 RepID=A0A2A4K332_HELVI
MGDARKKLLEDILETLAKEMYNSGTMMDHPFDLGWNFSYLYKYHAINWILALQRGEDPNNGPEKRHLENLRTNMKEAQNLLPPSAGKLGEEDYEILFDALYRL